MTLSSSKWCFKGRNSHDYAFRYEEYDFGLNFENNLSYIAMSSRLKMTWIIGHYHKRVLIGTNCFFYGIISILLLHERRKTIPSTGFKKFLSMWSYNAMTFEGCHTDVWRQIISKCSGSLRQYMILALFTLETTLRFGWLRNDVTYKVVNVKAVEDDFKTIKSSKR